MPRLYLNTYMPLAATAAGLGACDQKGLQPLIDGSIRREPDLQHRYPSITCLCRGKNFAPRLREGDCVVYITKKLAGPFKRAGRRATAVLRVDRRFDSHAEAASWYASEGLHLPSNCMVEGNTHCPLSESHRHNDTGNALNEERWARAWDGGYQYRARRCGTFVVCQPVWLNLGWDAPTVHDEDLRATLGRIPGTRNPGALPIELLADFMTQLRMKVPPSCP